MFFGQLQLRQFLITFLILFMMITMSLRNVWIISSLNAKNDCTEKCENYSEQKKLEFLVAEIIKLRNVMKSLKDDKKNQK